MQNQQKCGNWYDIIWYWLLYLLMESNCFDHILVDRMACKLRYILPDVLTTISGAQHSSSMQPIDIIMFYRSPTPDKINPLPKLSQLVDMMHLLLTGAECSYRLLWWRRFAVTNQPIKINHRILFGWIYN